MVSWQYLSGTIHSWGKFQLRRGSILFCCCFIKKNEIKSFWLKIRNNGKPSICVDSQEIEDHDKPIIGYTCHGLGGNQYFLLSKTYEIRREEKCLDYAPGKLREPLKIRSMDCHSLQGNQMWSYEVYLSSSTNYFN